MAREIRRDTGVDLFEVFENLEEFQNFLYGNIISHRLKMEYNLAISNSFPKKLIEYLKQVFEKEPYAGEQKFMENLFDKGRLRRMAARKEKERKDENQNQKIR